MTSIPPYLARVPTMLSSHLMLRSINNTNQGLLRTQVELATGQRVLNPSDDAISASTITALDASLEIRDQRLRNLSHAEGVLNTIDAALADATNLMIEVKGIGMSQIGVGSDPDTRANQAQVVNSILNEMITIGNRQYQDIHLFGGTATANAPLLELLGGVQYLGQGIWDCPMSSPSQCPEHRRSAP